MTEYVENVPPFLIVPGDVVDFNVNTPDFVEISTQEGIVVYFLVLEMVFEIKSNHFYCYFRSNDRQCYIYYGLKTPIVSTAKNPVILNLKEKLGFLVYISSKYISPQNFKKQGKHFKEKTKKYGRRKIAYLH